MESIFQIIYRDQDTIWAILPLQRENGLSRIWPKFFQSWDYRKKLSLGGDHRIIAGILSFIGSWTAALACLEDFRDFLRGS